VVVSRTEVGPINAVAATTLAIVNFKPKLVINQGTAGANDPELKIFDIVVGEATVDYGAFRSSHADAGKGIDMSRWTPLHHRLRIDGKERKAYPRFAADEPESPSHATFISPKCCKRGSASRRPRASSELNGDNSSTGGNYGARNRNPRHTRDRHPGQEFRKRPYR
jgi:Phosphorylase superfamily